MCFWGEGGDGAARGGNEVFRAFFSIKAMQSLSNLVLCCPHLLWWLLSPPDHQGDILHNLKAGGGARGPGTGGVGGVQLESGGLKG